MIIKVNFLKFDFLLFKIYLIFLFFYKKGFMNEYNFFYVIMLKKNVSKGINEIFFFVKDNVFFIFVVEMNVNRILSVMCIEFVVR